MSHRSIDKGDLSLPFFLDLPSMIDADDALVIPHHTDLNFFTKPVGRGGGYTNKRHGVNRESRTECRNLGGNITPEGRTSPHAGRTVPAILLLGEFPGERAGADFPRSQLGRHLDNPRAARPSYAEDFSNGVYTDEGSFSDDSGIYADDEFSHELSYDSFELINRLAGDKRGPFDHRADGEHRPDPRSYRLPHRPAPLRPCPFDSVGDDVTELVRANPAHECTLLRYGCKGDGRRLYRRSKKMMRSEPGRTFTPPSIVRPGRRWENAAVRRNRSRAYAQGTCFMPIWKNPAYGEDGALPTPLCYPVPVRAGSCEGTHRSRTPRPHRPDDTQEEGLRASPALRRWVEC